MTVRPDVINVATVRGRSEERKLALLAFCRLLLSKAWQRCDLITETLRGVDE